MAGMLVGRRSCAGPRFRASRIAVSPDILGRPSGRGVGAVSALLSPQGGVFCNQGVAFVGGLIQWAVVYCRRSVRSQRSDPGVGPDKACVVGSLSEPAALRQIYRRSLQSASGAEFMALGSCLADRSFDLLPLFGPVALGTAVIGWRCVRMNVMSCRKRGARAGVATGPLRIAIVAAATLVTSDSVPRRIMGVARVPISQGRWVGPDFARLLPAAGHILGGRLFLC